MITKPEGFDPNSKAFKNNWVNNLMKSGRKSPRGHATNMTNMSMANMTAVDGRGNNLSGIPSASVTATTVFPGIGGDARANASASRMQRNASYDPMSNSMFKAQMNNLVDDSPVTMMDMSPEDKVTAGRLA